MTRTMRCFHLTGFGQALQPAEKPLPQPTGFTRLASSNAWLNGGSTTEWTTASEADRSLCMTLPFSRDS